MGTFVKLMGSPLWDPLALRRTTPQMSLITKLACPWLFLLIVQRQPLLILVLSRPPVYVRNHFFSMLIDVVQGYLLCTHSSPFHLWLIGAFVKLIGSPFLHPWASRRTTPSNERVNKTGMSSAILVNRSQAASSAITPCCWTLSLAYVRSHFGVSDCLGDYLLCNLALCS